MVFKAGILGIDIDVENVATIRLGLVEGWLERSQYDLIIGEVGCCLGKFQDIARKQFSY